MVRERVFEDRDHTYTLVAFGPDENVEAALAAVETLLRTAERPLAGLVEVHGCHVRFAWS